MTVVSTPSSGGGLPDLGVFASSGLDGPELIAFTDDAGHPLSLANQPVPEPSTWAMLALFVYSMRAGSTQTVPSL